MTRGLNGVAHVILTAGNFARSTAFWRDMIGYLGLKLVLDSDAMLYGVGGRTAIGIRTPSAENVGKRFDQGAPGLHHACFRMRDRAAVDAVHAFLAKRTDIQIVHPPAGGALGAGLLFGVVRGSRRHSDRVQPCAGEWLARRRAGHRRR